uniref:Uncharacterized protein n=1 Tax=Candidatus Kentrum eta TaxID=2126337 RepID=A0A450V9G8_9GAMM|nr:MAG: hypothetical protein BECKH772A_GA0070896_1006418 [Candidatus Kentron sp. H]VFJ94753.1 MAG: hypothetical protein BECKH772B_GA0070898_1006618 [Candidatus Kentron sp. H]VFK01357.1 MAG: hypothetical protein BECKH772C_GA0070978_1006317 [Candidatus Kentron sp. H]
MSNGNGRFSPVRELTTVRNVLAVPNLIGKDEVPDIAEKINAELDENQYFTVVRYDYQSKEHKDPGDPGRAMIIDEMQREELRTIRKMIEQNLVGDRAMLAKDGGLPYRKDKQDKELSPLKDDVVQLRNVIGLAKTFKPELTLGKGRSRQQNLLCHVSAQRPATADARMRSASSLFNVKCPDLLAVYRPNDKLTEHQKAEWRKCGLKPRPLENVTYFHPYAKDRKGVFTDSQAPLDVIEAQMAGNRAFNDYYDVETFKGGEEGNETDVGRDKLGLLFSDIDDPQSTMERCIHALGEKEAYELFPGIPAPRGFL